MPPTIRETLSYDDYSSAVDTFQQRMASAKTSDGDARAEYSEERSKGEDVRRFVAVDAHGSIVGWMILKTLPDEVKIEGICVDYDATAKKGVAKAFITRAVNVSFQSGKGGTVILTNSSKGTGDSLYTYMGFQYTDGDSKMRLTLPRSSEMTASPGWNWKQSGGVKTAKGTKLEMTELVFE